MHSTTQKMGIFVSVLSFLTFILAIVADVNYSSAQQLVALLDQNISLQCLLDPVVRDLIWQQGSRTILIHRNIQMNTTVTEDSVKWYSETDLNQLRSTLIIKHVQFNDSGSFSCLQYFERGSTKVSTYVLQVQGFPYLSIAPNISMENDTMIASCCVESSTNISKETFSWFLGNDPIVQTSTTIKEEHKSGFVKYCSEDLHIFTSRYIHGNILTCLARNKVNLSASVVVNVQYPATIRMRTITSVQIFNKDCVVTISCEADGNPRPEVKLQKEISNELWKMLPNKSNIQSKFGEKFTLVFHLRDTCREIRGRYRCLASNKIESTLFTDSVEVLYEFPIMNYSTAILILVFVLIVVFTLIKVCRKRQQTQYDFFKEATRRHTQRLTNNIRTLTRSLRRADGSNSFSGSSQSTTTPGEQPVRECGVESDRMTYAKSIKRKEGTLPLEVHYNTLENDPKYMTLK